MDIMESDFNYRYANGAYKKDFQGNTSDMDEEPVPPLVNKKALSRNASTYELEKFKNKILFIFNHEHFERHPSRHGTDKDAEALRRSFEKYDFEVRVYKDYKVHNIMEVLHSFMKQDLSEYGCLAVAILTHGSYNGTLLALDREYAETDIIEVFKAHNNPTLFTKPKVIIIEACRGANVDRGVPVFQLQSFHPQSDDNMEPYFLPTESDMLILHSSHVGNVSYRDVMQGSWFIQTLCNKISTLGDTQDLETIATEVKREVAINKYHEEFNRQYSRMMVGKQMPVITSTLIRKLYLRKLGDVPSKLKTLHIEVKNGVLGKIIRNSPMINGENGLEDPCSCYLNHFKYMKMCLKYYLEENPQDEIANNFWEVVNSLEDCEAFNLTKQKMIKMISKHLKKNADKCHFFKFVYFNDN